MSELKAYLCIQAREIEIKTFSCYNQTLAVKDAPEATMAQVYLKSEADKVIAELKAENERLRGESCKLTDGCLRLKQCRKEKASLAVSLRKTKRALYKACANWARFEGALFADEHEAEKWSKMERECLKKAEEYK